MSKLTFFTFFLVLILLFSCQQESQNTEEIASNFELKIVDSIQVDLFSSGLNILDVNDKTGEILAIQPNPPIAYVLSPEGKVLKKMDKPAQSPEGVGDNLLAGEFYEDGIALMGFMKVKTYDMDFNLRESTKPDFPHGGMIYMGFNHLFEIKGNDHNRLLAYFGPQTELRAQVPEYYRELKIASIIDPYLVGKEDLNTNNLDNKVYKPVGGLTDDSRYITSGRAFYFMKPVFDVKDNMLHYAFADDTSMFKVSLPSGELLEETRIPFDSFILFNGYTMGQAGFKEQTQPRDRSGRIEALFSVGDFEVLIYYSGMKLSEVDALDRNSPDFRERLEKIDFKKHLILKNGLRMNEDLRLPDKVSYFNMADNEGFLWAHKDISNLEEEPDLITFYKLKVVQSKSN